ncbi:Small-conductance mechanosensitive channel [Chitinophaga terrae (ex Kim and Jung 2007)]|uniref:Small-conductance mechanosensitive channel n=1 Tax=Chitinophaga terrae (ex Kim and Jung 2007) TaxID=408074 RepID=A0A1H4ARM1_9BACT|nr:mechanosensitive ion channel domain-containing protein [Chitinophaga terrae (ex Kim and Jung 2007)]MDQ0106717.1 small-conductance mechanosensitive channel [Chitinophaga terrae (ex Kim and Jung 2007)]GEP89184.1 membrane protein [Chitinophaga terrae (ex Kim and Jung 2007)]SEA38407.1 Small-conductance mechanosensitive channel [Chitinophaga terrae (ex Kim and Jung 2007)]
MWNQILERTEHLPDFLWNLILAGIAVILGWLIKYLLAIFLRQSVKNGNQFSLIHSILLRTGKAFNYLLPILLLNMALPMMRLKPKFEMIISKVLEIALTLSFAALVIGIIKVLEDYIYHTYDLNKANNLKERKIRTQLQFVRKFVVSLILILTAAAILLSFDSMRKLGAGLLTGVGVGGIIIGFAAQKSLGNLLAGFQIAFTQPIRIDDVLVVEGEWGRVEEITLTYVVLNIWDQRKLILPINYFIEKPFQNWTRTGSEILGTAFFYLDYTVPVDKLRAEFERLLSLSPLWDKRAKALQVTNITERTVEVRTLMSATTSGNAFDLRCYMRENMLKFIQDNYPECLPKTRAEIQAETAVKNIT